MGDNSTSLLFVTFSLLFCELVTLFSRISDHLPHAECRRCFLSFRDEIALKKKKFVVVPVRHSVHFFFLSLSLSFLSLPVCLGSIQVAAARTARPRRVRITATAQSSSSLCEFFILYSGVGLTWAAVAVHLSLRKKEEKNLEQPIVGTSIT